MTKRQSFFGATVSGKGQTSPGAQFDRVKLISQAWVTDCGSNCAHERAQLVQILDLLAEDSWRNVYAGELEVRPLHDEHLPRSERCDLRHVRFLETRDERGAVSQPPPQSQAVEFAFTYATIHLIPLLTRIWPVPDDLPHAAGMGDLSRVKRWFDASGAPTPGDIEKHYPSSPYMPKGRVEEYAGQWGAPSEQRVLDTALAFFVINRHFDVADFLLEHGADINTNWNSHEPASILHHLVMLPNSYESMRFLIDRGIDMTIKDYRWDSNAAGWARHGYNNETMAQWLEEAERQREQGR